MLEKDIILQSLPFRSKKFDLRMTLVSVTSKASTRIILEILKITGWVKNMLKLKMKCQLVVTHPSAKLHTVENYLKHSKKRLV